MTNDNSSILSYLADKQRFTNGNEDIATEVLRYILSKSVACRGALRKIVRVGDADVGPLASVKTQDTGDHGERPDLAGLDRRGLRRVLIEVKFWAGLTENQPNTYLDRLPNDGKPAVLLFVAPKARLETLWPEVLRRADGKVIPEDTRAEDIRSAIVDGSEHRLMLTSWRELLREMRDQASTEGDLAAERDILQLNALCEREDSGAFLPLRPEEFGPEFPRRMLNLVELVNDATAHGRKEGFVNTTSMRATPQFYGYGVYMRMGKDKFRKQVDPYAVAWFGVNYYLWANDSETPLWLMFEDTGTISTAEVRHKTGMMINDYPNIPIHLPLGVEHKAVLDAVVEQLGEVAHRISPPRGRRPSPRH